MKFSVKFSLYLLFLQCAQAWSTSSPTLSQAVFFTLKNAGMTHVVGTNFYESLSVHYIDPTIPCSPACQVAVRIPILDDHALLAVSNNGVFVTAGHLSTLSRVRSIIQFYDLDIGPTQASVNYQKRVLFSDTNNEYAEGRYEGPHVGTARFDVPRAAITEDGTKIALFMRDRSHVAFIRIFEINPQNGVVLNHWDIRAPTMSNSRLTFEPIFTIGPGMRSQTIGYSNQFLYVLVKDQARLDSFVYRYDLPMRSAGVNILRLQDYYRLNTPSSLGELVHMSIGRFQLPGGSSEFALFFQDDAGYQQQSGYGWKLKLVHVGSSGQYESSINLNTFTGNDTQLMSLYNTLSAHMFPERAQYMGQTNKYIQAVDSSYTSSNGTFIQSEKLNQRPLYDVYQYVIQNLSYPNPIELLQTPDIIFNLCIPSYFPPL
ncbi:MAG: hypothetical protein HYS98_06800 [Deltaproteobacteria bacterium]|nr:hypothetical protein [Deltaproteobacteria bacterium]